jgi:hypothetical protein
MGAVCALQEGTPPVPDTPSDPTELVGEVRMYARSLDVVNALRRYQTALGALDMPEMRGAYYFLMHLQPEKEVIQVIQYRKEQLQQATERYLEVERALKEPDEAVLVSVESLSALRRAYPNYFLNTQAFTDAVAQAISD